MLTFDRWDTSCQGLLLWDCLLLASPSNTPLLAFSYKIRVLSLDVLGRFWGSLGGFGPGGGGSFAFGDSFESGLGGLGIHLGQGLRGTQQLVAFPLFYKLLHVVTGTDGPARLDQNHGY